MLRSFDFHRLQRYVTVLQHARTRHQALLGLLNRLHRLRHRHPRRSLRNDAVHTIPLPPWFSPRHHQPDEDGAGHALWNGRRLDLGSVGARLRSPRKGELPLVGRDRFVVRMQATNSLSRDGYYHYPKPSDFDNVCNLINVQVALAYTTFGLAVFQMCIVFAFAGYTLLYLDQEVGITLVSSPLAVLIPLTAGPHRTDQRPRRPSPPRPQVRSRPPKRPPSNSAPICRSCRSRLPYDRWCSRRNPLVEEGARPFGRWRSGTEEVELGW